MEKAAVNGIPIDDDESEQPAPKTPKTVWDPSLLDPQLFDMAVAQEEEEAGSTSEPRRYCTIKDSYPYKMCEPCRIRHRQYGLTKRAKSKAERVAFDQELSSLRLAEDEKRKEKGLPPLSESPEELRAWELSIVDETVKLPPSLVAVLAKSASAGSNSPFAKPFMSPAAEEPDEDDAEDDVEEDVEEDAPTSPVGGISTPSSSNTPPIATLPPQRMCTVSHCHKILPPNYLYKRCEEHRIQNRKYSRLKWVRERAVKASAIGTPSSVFVMVGTGQGAGEIVGEEGLEESQEVPGTAPYGIGTGRKIQFRFDERSAGIPSGQSRNQEASEESTSSGHPIPETTVPTPMPLPLPASTSVPVTLYASSEPESTPQPDFNSAPKEVPSPEQEWERLARERASKLIKAKITDEERREKERKGKGKRKREEEGEEDGSTEDPDAEDGAKRSKVVVPTDVGSNHHVNEKRRSFTCTNIGCMNLVNPDLRWRMCDICREVRKDLRLKAKAQEKERTETQDEEDPTEPSSNAQSASNNGDGDGDVLPSSSSSEGPQTLIPAFPSTDVKALAMVIANAIANGSVGAVPQSQPASKGENAQQSQSHRTTSVTQSSIQNAVFPVVLAPSSSSLNSTSPNPTALGFGPIPMVPKEGMAAVTLTSGSDGNKVQEIQSKGSQPSVPQKRKLKADVNTNTDTGSAASSSTTTAAPTTDSNEEKSASSVPTTTTRTAIEAQGKSETGASKPKRKRARAKPKSTVPASTTTTSLPPSDPGPSQPPYPGPHPHTHPYAHSPYGYGYYNYMPLPYPYPYPPPPTQTQPGEAGPSSTVIPPSYNYYPYPIPPGYAYPPTTAPPPGAVPPGAFASSSGVPPVSALTPVLDTNPTPKVKGKTKAKGKKKETQKEKECSSERPAVATEGETQTRVVDTPADSIIDRPPSMQSSRSSVTNTTEIVYHPSQPEGQSSVPTSGPVSIPGSEIPLPLPPSQVACSGTVSMTSSSHFPPPAPVYTRYTPTMADTSTFTLRPYQDKFRHYQVPNPAPMSSAETENEITSSSSTPRSSSTPVPVDMNMLHQYKPESRQKQSLVAVKSATVYTRSPTWKLRDGTLEPINKNNNVPIAHDVSTPLEKEESLRFKFYGAPDPGSSAPKVVNPPSPASLPSSSSTTYTYGNGNGVGLGYGYGYGYAPSQVGVTPYTYATNQTFKPHYNTKFVSVDPASKVKVSGPEIGGSGSAAGFVESDAIGSTRLAPTSNLAVGSEKEAESRGAADAFVSLPSHSAAGIVVQAAPPQLDERHETETRNVESNPEPPFVDATSRPSNAVNTSNHDAVVGLPLQRQCKMSSCNRTLSQNNSSGPLCDKCKIRLKKRQANTKTRFKLEPKKAIIVKKPTTVRIEAPTSAPVASANDEDEDEDEDVNMVEVALVGENS
ncbi:hypothetical protein VKT23_005924 [Stygiomarasmius scandens]|uniref:Uncharacterized protein n=1 Tax=Marasmiellus scandens TaxID=2682957 RepID=A0ABR1JT78_9AGAR